MADLKRWPMALNQPGYEYPAELFRAEHHDATSGGNGVGAPTALKVIAQAAPDGTVSILPGGATVKSTYAGADGQSYHARNFQPFTLTVPPTGSSSGGRTDLLVLRVCDPQYDVHPENAGEISAEDAAGLDFWWFELLQGQDRNASLDFPHVKLAEVVRPANVTVVSNSHIRDVRVLANGNTERFLDMVHPSGTTDITGQNYHTVGTIHVPVPEYATVAKVRADFAGIAIIQGGWVSGQVNGVFPGQSLEATWYRGHAYSSSQSGSVSSFTAKTIDVPESWRGTVQPFQFRVRRESGVDAGMARVDAGTTLTLDINFEQDVA